MKTRIQFILPALTLACGLSLASCSDDNTSDLRLDGDCLVESLQLNGAYTGQIDLSTRTIKVKVPVSYADKSAMTLTDLTLSNGAEANMTQGQTIDFTEPRGLHVTNGDVYLNWTVNVKNDEARITSFILNDTYKGSINEEEHLITFFLPASVDIAKLTPTITISEDATITPRSGVVTDFSEPVTYTVTDNTASAQYTVMVQSVSAPAAIFLGSADANTMDDLCNEEKEACRWMLSNVENSLFVSWEDLKNGNVDLSKCHVIWWHWQHSPSESITDFENGATSSAMSALTTLMSYYQNGGSFIFSRACVNMAAELGAVKDHRCANNCWGSSDDGGDVVSDPWSFYAYDESHALWQGMIDGANPVKCNDAGYTISNCTSQWGMWGDYASGYLTWQELTGCRALGHGGDGAISVWECPAANGSFGPGGIICFGSGCYDWWSPTDYTAYYHDNVGLMTGNAFDYLMGK